MEFALVLPIVLVLIIGIAEFGYFVALNSSVVSASREAARIGSSVGDSDGDTVPNYIDCDTIRLRAHNAAGALISAANLQITVTYDDGPGDASPTTACPPDLAAGAVDTFDRIIIRVQYGYTAMTPIGQVFLGPRTLEHIDRRSVGNKDV